MQQVIKFIGKVSFEGRVNGLPDEVFSFLTTQDADATLVSTAIAEQFARYRNMGGMVVETNQGALMNPNVSWLSHMYVPFHWIVRVTVAFHNLSKEVSAPDEKGVERHADGSEPRKQ